MTIAAASPGQVSVFRLSVGLAAHFRATAEN